MTHELNKLDYFLDIALGTSYSVLICHGDPTELNRHLAQHYVVLDADGCIPKEQRSQWRTLMECLGINRRYWRDPDLLNEDSIPITDL